MGTYVDEFAYCAWLNYLFRCLLIIQTTPAFLLFVFCCQKRHKIKASSASIALPALLKPSKIAASSIDFLVTASAHLGAAGLAPLGLGLVVVAALLRWLSTEFGAYLVAILVAVALWSRRSSRAAKPPAARELDAQLASKRISKFKERRARRKAHASSSEDSDENGIAEDGAGDWTSAAKVSKKIRRRN